MPIKLLKIKNFKSIKYLPLNCRRINLFIGEPNTGKSNILEVIGILSTLGHGRINNFVRFESMIDLFYDKVLDDPIRIEYNKSSLEIKFSDGQFVGSHKFPVKTSEGTVYHKTNLFRLRYEGGESGRHNLFEKFKFYRFTKRSNFPNEKSEFLQPPDGDNLLAVIMTRKGLRRIANGLFGKYGYRIVFKPQEGRIEIWKELEDIVFSLPYALTSETLRRLIFYLSAIYSNKNSILTFEEPEAHAFPYYTKYLAERIIMDENNNQYFITTHNPYFLTSVLEKTPKKDVAVFATSLENYQTKAKPLTEKQKKEILVDMGYDIFFNIEKILRQRKG